MTSLSSHLPSFLQACLGRAPKEEAASEPATAQVTMAMASHELDDLYKGARHSRQHILQSSELKSHFDVLAGGQKPKYHVIACSDSRVSPPEIFRMRPGSMFENQHLGALMPPVPAYPLAQGERIEPEWAAVAFAILELKVQHLVVLGHTGCGAVAGVMAPDKIAHNPWVASHLAHHKDLAERVNARFKGLDADALGLAAVGESVLMTFEKVNRFKPVADAVQSGALKVHAMVYEIGNHGAISVWDAAAGEFTAVNAETSMLPRRDGGKVV